MTNTTKTRTKQLSISNNGVMPDVRVSTLQSDSDSFGLVEAVAVAVPSGETRPIEFVLVGCGGTGSWLAPGVVRMAWEMSRMGRKVSVVFYDHDFVEEKNIPRQNFCFAELGMNKAEALALRLSAAWGVEIDVRGKFDSTNYKQTYSYYGDNSPLILFIGAVDNAAARTSLAQALENNAVNGRGEEAPRLWWIDCGNSKAHGQVLIGTHNRSENLRKAFLLGCNALPSPALQHPELLEPQPEELEDTSRLSCAELTALNLQSLTINKLIASVAEDMLYRLLFGKLLHFAVYVSQEAATMKAKYTSQREVAKVLGVNPAKFFNVTWGQGGKSER